MCSAGVMLQIFGYRCELDELDTAAQVSNERSLRATMPRPQKSSAVTSDCPLFIMARACHNVTLSTLVLLFHSMTCVASFIVWAPNCIFLFPSLIPADSSEGPRFWGKCRRADLDHQCHSCSHLAW